MNPKYNRKVGTAITKVPIKTNQVLPDNVTAILQELSVDINVRGHIVRDAYITALRKAGWTLQAVGTAANISRERVRQIEAKTPDSLVQEISIFSNEFPIPEVPSITIEEDVYEICYPSDETLARLKELQPYAQLVRSNSPNFRKESEEYTALLWHAHSVENVTVYRLAKCLGVTSGAIRFRLARYGYISPSRGGESRVYRKIREENRFKS